MIRKLLERLEAWPKREVWLGLDSNGAIAWRRSAETVLEEIGAWQSYLLEQGVRAQDRVAIDLPRGPKLLPVHAAVLALGATVVPINPALAAAERARVLERAQVRTLVSPSDLPGPRRPVRLASCDPAQPALLIFTSGTTGQPKGVPLTSANLEANLEALSRAWGIGSEDRLLHVLPCHHVHGLVLALYGGARAGASIVLAPRFDAERCIETLSSQGTTLFMGVPTMFRRMTRAANARPLETMRLFISGSAPLDPLDFADFEARFGERPLERYGLSETMIVATNPLGAERRPGTVGQPLPGTEIRLAQDGEIEVRGPAVMAGYWQAPELSRAAFHDGFFRSGDLGRFDEAGYLCISGRKKELIIVGGSNVMPGEVEARLSGDPGVEELAAAGLADADRGEVVAAFVVVAAGHEPAEIERRLRRRAERELAAYKRPRVYRFLEALPRNAMGKVDRKQLGG